MLSDVLDDFFEDNQDSNIENMVPDNQNVAKILQRCSHSVKEGQPQEQHCNILKQYFGHTVFRPLQWQIIQSILEEKRDNCVVMATGYGKSLCYQYPAVFTQGLSVVISPLISLMEDQVICLKNQNIPACFLGSAQNRKTEVMNQLMNNHYRVVYLTPEYATGEMGEDLLTRLHQATKICLLAIDEAHCVSGWGHAFRPQYRDLGKLRKLLPSVPILAVTATATDAVTNDIIESLGLRCPQVLCSGFDRPNLFFEVRDKSSSMYADLSSVINQNDAFNLKNSSIIIYCLTKLNTEKAASILKGCGFNCEFYHAGLPLETRKKIHEKFINNEIQIIVATIAFGMGINKPDVRCVIHYGTSTEMEKYYQEAGRAGRDGLPALCVLFHSRKDLDVHKYFRDFSNLSEELKAHKDALSIVMQHYVSTSECRRHYIISYFEGNKEPLTGAKANCCDNCNLKRQRDGVVNVERQMLLIKEEPTPQVCSVQTQPEFDNEALLQELQNLKNSLENIRKMMPRTVSIDNALTDLSVLTTSTTVHGINNVDKESLHNVEQFSQSCVNIVQNIVETNLTQEQTALVDALRKYSLRNITDTEFLSVSMFEDGMELHEIANLRNLSEDIVLEHLISGIEATSEVDIRRLLSASTLSSIIEATQSPAVSYDLKKLLEIKFICGENVSMNEIKIAVAFLNVRIHLRNISYKDDFAITTIDNSTKFVSALVTPTNNWIPNLSKYSSPLFDDYKKSAIIKNDPDTKPKYNILKPCAFKYKTSSEVENIFNKCEKNTIIKKDPDEIPKSNTLNTLVYKPSSRGIDILKYFKKSRVIKKDPDPEPKANSPDTCVFKCRPSSQVKNNTDYSFINNYEKNTVVKTEPDEDPKENSLDTCIFEYRPRSQVKNFFKNRTPQKFEDLEDINNVSDCIKLKPVPLIELLDVKISTPGLPKKDTVDIISDKSDIENGESVNAFMTLNNNNEFEIMNGEKCNKGDFISDNLEEIEPNVHCSSSKETIIKSEWDNDVEFLNSSFDQLDQVVIEALSQGSIPSMNSQPEKELESQLIADDSGKIHKRPFSKRILPDWMNCNNTVLKNKIKKKKTIYID